MTASIPGEGSSQQAHTLDFSGQMCIFNPAKVAGLSSGWPIFDVMNYGAKGDGVTDDTAAFQEAINAAVAAGGGYVSASGSTRTYLINGNLVFGATNVWIIAAGTVKLQTTIYNQNQGRFVASTGGYQSFELGAWNKRAPNHSIIKTAPPYTGPENGLNQALNGDFNGVQFAFEHYIDGAATLGQPVNGYQYTPGASAIYGYFQNHSGWNQGTNDNSGRTGATAIRMKMLNDGQGDCVAFNFSAFVTGQRAGATDVLANPAVSGLNGDCSAGSDGVYLNPLEIHMHDNGHDVAAVGAVYNAIRTNRTGNIGAFWEGCAVQNNPSEGATANIDAGYVVRGLTQIGIDMAGCVFPNGAAAISMPRNSYVYMDTTNPTVTKRARDTVLGNTFFGFNGTTTAIEFTAGGTLALSIPSATKGVQIGGGGFIESGTGAPTATRAAGSLFLRTDGGTGSRLYVSSGGGVWNAVAGV